MAMLNNQMVINDQFELLANNEINHLKRIRSYISYWFRGLGTKD